MATQLTAKQNDWVEPMLIKCGDNRVLLNGRPPSVNCRIVAENLWQKIMSELEALKSHPSPAPQQEAQDSKSADLNGQLRIYHDLIQGILIEHRGHAGGAREILKEIVEPLLLRLEAYKGHHPSAAPQQEEARSVDDSIVCPECGCAYDDILGIGKCGSCFYKHKGGGE